MMRTKSQVGDLHPCFDSRGTLQNEHIRQAVACIHEELTDVYGLLVAKVHSVAPVD